MKKQTFKQFLIEAPLPDDWDSGIYNPRIPFTKRLAYAKERAKRIGSGSSRVAFVIPYEGRDTVLKVAKNIKGMAQNEEEAKQLSDWYLKKLEIAIPMIDYDKSSDRPTWIHLEKAEKAKVSDFRKLGCRDPLDLIVYALTITGNMNDPYGEKWRRYKYPDGIDDENETVQAFADYVSSYKPVLGDYGTLRNWGVYKGKLVIIDIGLSQDVLDTHYSGK